jgi:hypothetical protein
MEVANNTPCQQARHAERMPGNISGEPGSGALDKSPDQVSNWMQGQGNQRKVLIQEGNLLFPTLNMGATDGQKCRKRKVGIFWRLPRHSPQCTDQLSALQNNGGSELYTLPAGEACRADGREYIWGTRLWRLDRSPDQVSNWRQGQGNQRKVLIQDGNLLFPTLNMGATGGRKCRIRKVGILFETPPPITDAAPAMSLPVGGLRLHLSILNRVGLNFERGTSPGFVCATSHSPRYMPAGPATVALDKSPDRCPTDGCQSGAPPGSADTSGKPAIPHTDYGCNWWAEMQDTQGGNFLETPPAFPPM